MDRIFNMDNKFFTFMGHVADLVILNLLFIVCCIPIVTIGPAITALYYVTLKMARGEESYIVRPFFKSFKENLKQGIIIWLIVLALILILVCDFLIMSQASGQIYTVVKYGLALIALVLAMVTLYVFPLLAKFDNTIKGTFRNAMLMSIRHLPKTFLMLLIPVAAVIITLLTEQTLCYGILCWILVGFALMALVDSWFFAGIFDLYIPKEEENPEDLEGFAALDAMESGIYPPPRAQVTDDSTETTEE